MGELNVIISTSEAALIIRCRVFESIRQAIFLKRTFYFAGDPLNSLLGFSSSSYSLVEGGISTLLLLPAATEAVRCIRSNSNTAIADDEEVMMNE